MFDVYSSFVLYSIYIFWISNVAFSKLNNDPVDFTVVDDSTMSQSQKSSDGLPVEVMVNFDVLGSKVSLSLKRNPKATSAKHVYVIRKSEAGIPVILADGIVEQEVFGEYQDPMNGAIFTLFCPKQANGSTVANCDVTMEGTFRSGMEEYRMSPMEHTALGRVKRNANQLWKKAKTIATAATAFSKVYGIYKTEQLPGTPSDFKEGSPIIRGRVAAFGKETKTVRENVLPGGQKYNLEILAVIDYGIYERFYKASRQPTEAAKDNDAKYNIKKYFSHVFNGVDMLYQTIDDPEFSLSVAVTGFIIADSPQVSPWTTPHIDRNADGRHDLLVSRPLDELIRWSFSVRNIPENDHIMLLTDYDLYSMDSGKADKRTAGYARVGSVCSLDSVSVIEDHGGFQSINAAAHELGHGLGSRHDGKMNSCEADDQYIMTAHGGFETEKTKKNPWRFSRCSVAYFKYYISRLPPRHCLTDPVDLFDRVEYLKFISTYPGQDYSPNEQCQDILGLDSYYGWGPELGKFSDICTEMSCKVPGASRSYRVYKAATGTSCGDKKWCIEGKCIFDEKSPPKDPSCVFGDIQRRFSKNKSCRQYMLDNPMRCYDSFYNTRCCDTCDKLNTGVTGCEYGDKYLNCRANGCSKSSYARDCCSTCGLAPHPVIATTTPSTMTSHTTLPPWTPKPATRKPWTPKPATRKPWTHRPPTRKPWSPRPKHTTAKPWVPRPRPPTTRPTTTILPLTPSGITGLCIREDALFLLFFKCSSLPRLFGSDACDNPLVARYCCERCPAVGQTSCVDAPDCRVRYSRQCYSNTNRDKCCRTCRRFETGQPGCEYGDKIRSCERYVGELGISLVCSRYRDYCCGICTALATNKEPYSLNAISKPADLLHPTDPFHGGVVAKTGHTSPTLAPIEKKHGGKKDTHNKPGKVKKSGKKNGSRITDKKRKGPRINKHSISRGRNDTPVRVIPPRLNTVSNMSSTRVVRTFVYRPAMRRARIGMFRRTRPGQQRNNLLRRLNFFASRSG